MSGHLERATVRPTDEAAPAHLLAYGRTEFVAQWRAGSWLIAGSRNPRSPGEVAGSGYRYVAPLYRGSAPA